MFGQRNTCPRDDISCIRVLPRTGSEEIKKNMAYGEDCPICVELLGLAPLHCLDDVQGSFPK